MKFSAKGKTDDSVTPLEELKPMFFDGYKMDLLEITTELSSQNEIDDLILFLQVSRPCMPQTPFSRLETPEERKWAEKQHRSIANENAKIQARQEALEIACRNCPSSRSTSGAVVIENTAKAEELLKYADEVYAWLIKDLK